MNIIGHQKQWQLLKGLKELEDIPHALLFSGQEQLGKKTLAVELVKLFNCRKNEDIPCQKCEGCQNIQKGIHADFDLIAPASSNGEIQISQIRDLIRKLSFYSYSASFKTAIIDKAHLMTREAQNCFLKTLEEPKGKTLLILVTEYPEALLPTILSRVQRIKFFPVKKDEIRSHFVKSGISKTKAGHISSLSLGRPGMAVDFLLDEQKLKNQEKLVSDIEKISNSDFGFRFQYAKKLLQEISEDSPQKLKEVLDIWLGHFRKLFLFNLLQKQSQSKNKKIISLIQSTSYLISTTNINPKLALEILLMEF